MHRVGLWLCLLMGLAWPASAQDEAWRKVATVTLQPNLQQEAVDVSTAGGTITALRVEVQAGNVQIKRVSLVGSDGTTAFDGRSLRLREGQQERLLLTGTTTGQSRTVNIRYKSLDRKPAVLDVYAVVVPNAGAARPARRSASGRYHHHHPRRHSHGGGSGQAGTPEPTQQAPPPPSDCVQQITCTPVNVYFGTSRAPLGPDGQPTQSRDPKLVSFAAERATTTTLGRATVTVPRAFRQKGEIPQPSWWDILQFRNPTRIDPTRHFTWQKDATKFYASPRDYVTALREAMAEPGNSKDHVFIFVHGYNTSFENALFRAAQISYDLGENDQPFGTAMLFSWASSGATEHYAYDLDSADQGARHLEAFVKLVTDDLKPKHIHLIAHSMGNAVLLKALEDLARNTQGPAKIESVILAAPDVDAGEFQRIVAAVLPLSRSYTLYASAKDRAILASKKIRRNTPRAGDVLGTSPIIVAGLDSLDVSAISTDVLSLNHSDYADKKELLNDMSELMRRGTRPPDRRNASFHVEGRAPSLFWRFFQQ
jgi:esterase/lipase superfamily enzyme